MKKIFYLASIAALALSSCTKDETTEATLAPVTNGSKIVAAMEADDTRSELVKNDSGYDIVWKATDGLSVFSNGSGTEALPNVLFQLDNASDGLAAGAFNSKVATLNAKNKYVAVYPYSEDYKFVPAWDRVEYPDVQGYEVKGLLNPNSIELTIPAKQTYVPGSFNTNTIAAISTEFTVGENNTATVKMQPVVDYLMVDVVATEPIKSLMLNLYKGNTVDANLVPLAGTAPLTAYKVGDKTRYYIDADDIVLDPSNAILNNKTITLETKQLATDVALAKANTYVFVIPGGILGNNNNISAEIYVNGRQATNKLSLDIDGDGKDDVSDLNIYGPKNAPIYRSKNADNDFVQYGDLVYYNYNLENTVFYLNAKNDAGERTPFVYNPNNDKLIEDELDLLDYFYNYSTKNYGDAYVAENAKFNLSVDNLSEILRNKKDIDLGLRTAINDYIMPDGVFPVIETYNHQFIGNGATISNIERPLAGMGGLFGNMVDSDIEDHPTFVQNITLANVVAATKKVDGKEVKGNVLASLVDNNAKLDKIAISNLNADAVVGQASLVNFTAISVAEEGSVDKDLNHIVAVVELNNDYKPKAEVWSALSAVGEGVFNTIVPVNRPHESDSAKDDTHHIITLPAGDYEDLTEEFVNIGDKTEDGVPTASAVASLLIGEVSHWTGGYKNSYSSVNSNLFYYGDAYGVYLNYAEELANGFDGIPNFINAYALSRDMNFENNDLTRQINFSNAVLSGGGKTVTGLTYVVDEDNWNDEVGTTSGVAPFALTDIENIVFDGLTVAIETTSTYMVPRLISGISYGLQNVDGVTINNLVIDAYSVGSNNTITDAVYDQSEKGQRHVGWLSAGAEDIAVYDTTVNGVDSNVIALSAMVSWINVKTNNSIFDGSKVTGKIVKAKGQVDIKEFTRYNEKDVQYNLMGSLVGMVENAFEKDPVNVGVKFNDYGSVKPVSLYQVRINGSAINILYNNKLAVSLYHKDDKRNE